MKKIVILTVVLVLLAVSFSVVVAAPWSNPNGFWLEDVYCPDLAPEPFDVWVINNNSVASFASFGGVGITKALYIDFGSGYELVWQVPGKGLDKKTVWCEWEFDGMQVAGDILVP